MGVPGKGVSKHLAVCFDELLELLVVFGEPERLYIAIIGYGGSGRGKGVDARRYVYQ
jgi:hypothetical protein